MTEANPTSGTRGRPRRVETDRVIHTAARELLAESGYGELTIEGVARRAKVGKPTVYRRYDSKASLVAAALLETLEEANPKAPDTGDSAADARELLGNLAAALAAEFGQAVIEIISPAARDTHLAELFRVATEDRRHLIRAVLTRAADQNQLVPTDVEVAIDLALGAVYFRHLVTHEPIDSAFIDTVVASLIHDNPNSGSTEIR